MNADALDNLGIASPCSASWEDMEGDERRRFCGDCSLHVYNLSGLDRDEAVELITGREGSRVCIRMFKRADGTVITRNCPQGLARVKRRLARVAVLAATLLGAGAAGAVGLAGGDVTSCPSGAQASWVDRVAPLRWAKAAFASIEPDAFPVMGAMIAEPMMGDVAWEQDPVPQLVTP